MKRQVTHGRPKRSSRRPGAAVAIGVAIGLLGWLAPPVSAARLAVLGQFPVSSSASVAVDPQNGDVYVTTPSHTRAVDKRSAVGAPLLTFGPLGSAPGSFIVPSGVAVDPSTREVYVLDFYSAEGQKFTPTGTYESLFSTYPGQPQGVAVDPVSRAVYVTDGSGVQRFDSAGQLQLQFQAPLSSSQGIAAVPAGGAVWVADPAARLVREVTAAGTLLRAIDGSTSPSGPFSHPAGVAVDPATGDVYVTDSDKEVLQRFTAGGAFVAQISVNVNQEELPAVDPATGALYVADGSTVFIVGTPPAVSGTPLDGSTLYASRPTQVGRGPFTYAYQWLECTAPGTCANHGSPMSTNGLRLTPADEGKTFAVRVTATGAAGTVGPVTSDPVGPVAPAPPVNQAGPAISGTPADGAVLSATHGTWSGATVTSYAYRWQSCAGGSCVDVATNAAAYRLAPTDVGHTIQVAVTATNADGTGAPAIATPVGPVTPSPPSDQVPPRVTGTVAPGNRLQGSAGTWTGVLPIAYAYQWQRCPDGTTATCADIPGATLNNYRLTPADTTVRLVVTATNVDGTATAASLLAPFDLIGVGLDDRLYTRATLTSPWLAVPNSSGALAVTVLPDGRILVVGQDHTLHTRASLTSSDLPVPNSAGVRAATVLPDRTILADGQDRNLYTRATLTSPYVLVPGSCCVIAASVLGDGTILAIGNDEQLYTRATLTSPYVVVPGSGSVLDVTVLPDGTIVGLGTGGDLYTRATLTSAWVNVPGSGTVIAVAAAMHP